MKLSKNQELLIDSFKEIGLNEEEILGLMLMLRTETSQEAMLDWLKDICIERQELPKDDQEVKKKALEIFNKIVIPEITKLKSD